MTSTGSIKISEMKGHDFQRREREHLTLRGCRKRQTLGGGVGKGRRDRTAALQEDGVSTEGVGAGAEAGRDGAREAHCPLGAQE